MQSGMMVTAGRTNHLAAGNTMWNPAYRQHVLQNRQGRTLPYSVIRRLLYLVVDVVVHVHNDLTGGAGRHITELWYDPMMKRAPAPKD